MALLLKLSLLFEWRVSVCTFDDYAFVKLPCVLAFVCFAGTRLAAHFSAVRSAYYCLDRRNQTVA